VNDALGDRMKDSYENRARVMLPRRTYTIIRLDGKCFSGYTRGLDRPYDQQLMDDMTATAEYLCQEIAGARLAYTQSDEISILLTDFATPQTQPWFDGNVQKLVSISASLATARFNQLRPGRLAFFDSRAFTIPDPVEVGNYFVWRQKDATRNSISMAAQALFSHKQLHGKSSSDMQEMMWSERGVNWNDYDPRFKRGTAVWPEVRRGDVEYTNTRTGEKGVAQDVERHVWITGAAPIFTADNGFLATHIPMPRSAISSGVSE
jgi:tRNA(His) guanylyltransferase